MQTKPELSIVIPYFNESRRIDRNVSLVAPFLSKNPQIEIIYVNDGCIDGTEAILKSLLKTESCYSQIKFISNPENMGKGAAIKNGVQAANGQFILFSDFDIAISLEEVHKFLTKIKTLPLQTGAVIASRREESVIIQKQGLLRRFLSRSFHQVMKIIINIPVKDTQCGFKMFDAKTAKEVFPQLLTQGFAFDVEILKRIHLKKLPIVELGVEIANEDKFSTVNVYLDPLKMLSDLIKLRFKLLFNS